MMMMAHGKQTTSCSVTCGPVRHLLCIARPCMPHRNANMPRAAAWDGHSGRRGAPARTAPTRQSRAVVAEATRETLLRRLPVPNWRDHAAMWTHLPTWALSTRRGHTVWNSSPPPGTHMLPSHHHRVEHPARPAHCTPLPSNHPHRALPLLAAPASHPTGRPRSL